MRRRYRALALGTSVCLSIMGLAGIAAAAPSTELSPESVAMAHLSASQSAAFLALNVKQRHEVALALSDPRIADFALTDSQAKAIYPDISLVSESGAEAVSPSKIPVGASTRTALVGAAASASVVTWHAYYNHSATFFGKSYNTASLNFYYGVSGSSVVDSYSCVWSDSGWTVANIDNISANGWASGGLGYCYATVQLSTIPEPVHHGTLSQNMRVNSTKIVFKYFHQVGP